MDVEGSGRPRLTSSELSEVIDDARAVAAGAYPSDRAAQVFARALVQVAESCVVGLPCARHYDCVHGREAEELRAGVEQILGNTADVRSEDEESVLAATRKALIFLLDRIDARDSLAFREVSEGDVAC